MNARLDMIAALAEYLTTREHRHPLRVGIDGPCGSGKSTLTRELVAAIRAGGGVAVHLDSDGFHHTRAVRYRQGRASARGYYEDAYDFEALRSLVLEPLGGAGPFTYAPAVHDMGTDERLDLRASVPADAVVIFDCTFLQRGTLRDLWDEVIYLDTDRATALERGVSRDAAALGGTEAARAAYESRYMAACDLYVAEERPRERASVVVELSDPERPSVVQTRQPSPPRRTRHRGITQLSSCLSRPTPVAGRERVSATGDIPASSCRSKYSSRDKPWPAASASMRATAASESPRMSMSATGQTLALLSRRHDGNFDDSPAERTDPRAAP